MWGPIFIVASVSFFVVFVIVRGRRRRAADAAYVTHRAKKYVYDKRKFARWGKDRKWVVLDTETTGLGAGDEVIDIAVFAADGEVLLTQKLYPKAPISREASAVHGLTKKSLKDAPAYDVIHDDLIRVLKGRLVLAFNAEFDARMLRQTAAAHGLVLPELQFDCVMLAYAAHAGVPGRFPGDFKWWSLEKAVKKEGVEVIPDHSALGDARATLVLINKVSEK